MRKGGVNSFFRFVLGFTVFIALSLGLTFAVASFEEQQQKEEQTAAAFQTMLGVESDNEWWYFW